MRPTLIALILLSVAACKDKGGDTGGSGNTDGGTFTDTDIAESLWTEMSGYQSWGQVSGFEGVVASADGSHGPYVQIWLNTGALDTVEAAAGDTMPTGAILVKEGYDDAAGSSLRAVTAMKKINNYNGSAGDWFWAQFDGDGNVSAAGKVSSCISCHESGQDYVRSTTW